MNHLLCVALQNRQLYLDELSQYEAREVGALDTMTVDDATKGAMLVTGLTVAGAVILLTKGRLVGVGLVAGGLAAVATKVAIDRISKGA